MALDEAAERVPQLRRHNGTIWRWNRPLVGFDDAGARQRRIEHRPLAAGPSLVDMMANLVFAVGLLANGAHAATPPESALPFDVAMANFHAAACLGLDASLSWPGGPARPASELVLALLGPASDGLARLGVNDALARQALAVIEARVASRRTGARWQLQALDRRGGDLAAMTLDYAARQAGGDPVQLWD